MSSPYFTGDSIGAIEEMKIVDDDNDDILVTRW